MVRFLLFLIVALLASAPAHAQSLAEVAAKEEARRKQVDKPSPVYTNKDIKPWDRPTPTAATPATPSGQERPEGSPSAPADAAEGEDDDEETLTDEQQRQSDEQQWRARITEARAALSRSQIFAEALQSRINALWVDFTARDDPAQRAVIEAERRKALAQLDQVKAEIVQQTKAIADIEEEARRAGIPPGWLR